MIASLYFKNTSDITNFLRQSGLRNFLLLGKESVLIAQLTKEQYDLAFSFGGEKKETPEIRKAIRDYFQEVPVV